MPSGRTGQQEKKGGGSRLLVGCGTFLVLVVAAAAVMFVLYRSKINEYTSTAPAYLPESAGTAREADAIRKRMESYGKSLEAGTAAEPLVLSGEDLNVMIQKGGAAPNLADKVYIRTEGDTLYADFTLPLDRVVPMGGGRYLNGTAALRVSLENGVPVVHIDSVEANGKAVPDSVVRRLEKRLPLDRLTSDPEAAAALANVGAVEVRDGKLVITPKSR